MTFDDQLKRAFDTLSDRLRGEVDRHVQAVMDEFAATSHADRESAIAAAVDSARADREAAIAAAVSSARNEHEAAAASARQERDAAIAAAVEAERRDRDAAIDAAVASARREQDAAVEAAVEAARREGEAAVESVRQERDAALESARRERDAAVEAAVESAQRERDASVEAALESARREHASAVDAAVESARRERDAAVDAAVASARTEHAAALDAALASARLERDASSGSALATSPYAHEPVVVVDRLDQVAACVRAMSQAGSLTAVLDALMAGAAASGAMTNIWVVRGRQLEPWRPHAADGPPPRVDADADHPIAEVVRTRATATHGEVVASPLLLAGDVVAVLVTASPQPPAPSANALEILALYASRALESITAFKTARALTRQPDDSRAIAAPAPPRDETNAEEQASAQRYAKLLVSEIKLYHEADVVSGRRARDLMQRLGGEIAHARVMYEQRVPPHVRSHADYFHDELVRTLADGDGSLLDVKVKT